ncbi:MAG: GyrI-like domain-containing protein, partial [Lachnospiraceae bacterium]|nr:GyrI-like domain-containing protein [Lachnospiraceae bacterium]
VTANGREEGWDVCISLNYLSAEKSNGVMFGFLVESENQPESYDLLKLPGAYYMRLRICDEAAAALEQKPWKGGVPPYGWIAEDIAPKLGYIGVDTSPVFEYYGYFDPDKNEHKYCYLYVPVRKG